MNRILNLGCNKVSVCHLLITYIGGNKLFSGIIRSRWVKNANLSSCPSLQRQVEKKSCGISASPRAHLWLGWALSPDCSSAVAPWNKVFGSNSELRCGCSSLLVPTPVCCPPSYASPAVFHISTMSQVRKLIWLRSSIPENVLVFFSSLQPDSSDWFHVAQDWVAQVVVCCSREAGGGQRPARSTEVPDTCGNEVGPHLLQAQHTLRAVKGKQFPFSSDTRGWRCGTEKAALFPLIKYFWVAAVFTLLTDAKP